MITSPWFVMALWLIFALALLWGFSVIGPFFAGAPWAPMPEAKARRMLQLAGVRPGETVYDLGSGDGRVLILAAREFGARAVGVEIEPLRAFLSQRALRLRRLHDRARVIRANLFDVDLREADVITVYLLPKANARLAPKLRRELKPGARVAALAFTLPDWEPAVREGEIYVYQVSDQ